MLTLNKTFQEKRTIKILKLKLLLNCSFAYYCYTILSLTCRDTFSYFQSFLIHCTHLNRKFKFQDADRFCPTSFDSILCWPRTLKGSLATLPCLAELSGVHYDISSKTCTAISLQCVTLNRMIYDIKQSRGYFWDVL